MQLPKFSYVRSSSAEAACRNLAAFHPGACLVAGGTELFPRMKYGLSAPEVLISLKGAEVKPPAEAEDGALTLDALMTLADVSASTPVREKAPVLAEAAAAVGSGEIRNMATLGGNLCQESRCLYYNQAHDFQFATPCYKRGGEQCYSVARGKKCWAVFMSDTAPALISLRARVSVIGPAGSRNLSLEELYSDDPIRPLTLAPDEVLTNVRIPARPEHRCEAFVKFNWRGGFEFSALSVAAVMEMEADLRTCRRARITVGSIAAAPRRARKTEAALAGKSLSDGLIAAAAEQTVSEIRPIPHHGYSGAYLSECLRVQTRRVLTSAVSRFEGE